MAFWASPLTSGLATTTGRIEFVSLRTDCSLPVALHLLLQGRSYFPLMDSDQSMKGLAPFQSDAFTGALAGTLRVPWPTADGPFRTARSVFRGKLRTAHGVCLLRFIGASIEGTSSRLYRRSQWRRLRNRMLVRLG